MKVVTLRDTTLLLTIGLFVISMLLSVATGGLGVVKEGTRFALRQGTVRRDVDQRLGLLMFAVDRALVVVGGLAVLLTVAKAFVGSEDPDKTAGRDPQEAKRTFSVALGVALAALVLYMLLMVFSALRTRLP